MTRAHWWIASLCLLLLWLLAGAVWAPAVQDQLAREASVLIADIATGHPPVQIHFRGQQAHLSGKVRHAAESREIEERIRKHLRTALVLPDLTHRFNPVTEVFNTLEIAPYPPGWLLLSVRGNYAQLFGDTASEVERRDIAALLQERWSQNGGRLETRLRTSPDQFDEAPSIRATLDSFPKPPSSSGADSIQIYFARLGHSWSPLPLAEADEKIRAQFANEALPPTAWNDSIQPSLASARRQQQAEQARQAEAERQAKLPPPYVFLAARHQNLLLRGELASLKLKRELLNAIIAAYPDWKVIDDLRVNPERRLVANFGTLTAALLPQNDQNTPPLPTCALGLPGSDWKPIAWQFDADTPPPWQAFLPKDLPPDQVAEDGRMVIEWLQGNQHGIPALPQPAQPSFLTLTLLPGKVILAGQLAEEALRQRLIEAARRTYAGRALILTERLLARGTCEPTLDIEHTLRSFPSLPAAGESAQLAFARPGQTWKTHTATPELLKPGALGRSEFIPSDFPAAMAEDTFIDAFDHLRAYWRSLSTGSKNSP